MKFLALVCGIEKATSEHACIWCKCPKDDRYDMSMQWSITNCVQGARTVEEISAKSKLIKQVRKGLTVADPHVQFHSHGSRHDRFTPLILKNH